MDQEFSMEKQDFTIIKEKIIKTNDLLVLYNGKCENYAKAKHAFKQLKSKYEASMHETNRLKMDNERLNYSLETIRPKYEQYEKDLIELRADYTRTEEKYQQNMIESQLTISELEEKVKHCTCKTDVSLSPSKKLTTTERSREIKKITKDLREIESHLKNKNDNLQLENKELKAERQKNLKLIENFTAKNVDLQRDFMAVKSKIQKMELATNDQANLQLTISCLKQNHDKEINYLKRKISNLSLDNQRIKCLELECNNLKQQINNTEIMKIEKSDSCVQTEGASVYDKCSRDSNVEEIRILKQKCRELQEKLTCFENIPVSKEGCGIQKVVEQVHTLKVWENDSSDLEDSISDILSEMILPKALSPFSFFSRSETPTQPLLSTLEHFPLLDEHLPQEPFVPTPIPNIVITPPTPNIEKFSYSNVMFPLLIENTEEKQSNENMDETGSVIVDPVFLKESIGAIKRSESGISEIQPSRMNNTNTNEIMDSPYEESVASTRNIHTDKSPTPFIQTFLSVSPNTEASPEDAEPVVKEVLFKHPTNISGMVELKSLPAVDNQRHTAIIKYTNKNEISIKNANSIAIGTNHKADIYSAPANLVSTCEQFVSSEAELETKTHDISASENSKTFKVNVPKDSLNLKNTFQRRRKFWIPYNISSFVKLKKRRNQIKIAEVTKKHKEFSSNQPAQRDSILNALRTLQQNNINFTISNESIIPVVRPYNSFSLLTPPKAEPSTVCKKFTNTFSYSLPCWNRQCSADNTQMLLRKVQSEEEPDLLGFFSVKDEVITPSASRMAVLEKPKPVNAEDLITQLLSGIKELVDVKRKEYSGNRRKKRSKSKNRQSDFYSETETELEMLFRKSADVLGRNRRFLAAAKKQSFESDDESMFESETDDLADSGLVSRTPKIDTDSLSFCSRNELGEGVVPDNFSPIIRNVGDKQDRVLRKNSEVTITPLTNVENFVGFSSPSNSSSSTMVKSVDILKNETSSLLDNCTTPRFSTCPVMLSPISSSKGSPETLQVSSTPFKTPEFNTNSRTSPDCFKLPFCPIMISPMASSMGSPVSQTSKDTKINEDRFNSFRTPLCPSLVNPSGPFSTATSENCAEKSETKYNRKPDKPFPIKENNMLANILQIQGCNNIDLERRSLNEVKSPETLASHDIKPSCSGNKKSLVCQRITFGSVENSEHLDQGISISSMDFEKTRERKVLPINSLNLIDRSTFLDRADDSYGNELPVTSIISEGEKGYLAELTPDLHSEKLPIRTKEHNLESLEKTDESCLQIDLSLKSSDLDCTLDDISISQLELSSVPNEEPTDVNRLRKRYSSDDKQTCTVIQHKCPKEIDNYSSVERRYSLRRKSQCEGKKNDKIVSSVAENTIDFTSPRTRAAKRKWEEDSKCNGKEKLNITRQCNSLELELLAGPLKRKRGRPRNIDKITASSEYKGLSDTKFLNKSPAKISSKKTNKLEKNQKGKSSTPEEVVRISLFGSDSEDGGNISSTSDSNISKRDKIGKCKTSEGIGQQKKVKKLLKTLRRKSSNSNEDISKNIFGRELEAISGSTSSKDIENSGELTQDILRKKNNEIIVSSVRYPEDYAKDTKTTLSKEDQTDCRSRKIINKKCISKSESDCDISSRNDIEANQAKVAWLFRRNVSNYEKEQFAGNGLEYQGSALQENDLSTSNKALKKTAVREGEGKIETTEKLPGFENEKSSIQNHNFFNQTTLEIQNILKNLSEESAHVKNISLLNENNEDKKEAIAVTNGSSDVFQPLERHIFEDLLDSGMETTCCKEEDLRETQKIVSKKAINKQNFEKKMLDGMQFFSEENFLKEDKKIKVVQNILISKGKTFNLLSNSAQAKQPSSTTTSQKAAEHIRCPPTDVSEDSGIYSRKSIKLDQNISNTTTPVDILSQVMKGMIKTGPKTARKNISYQSNSYLSSDRGRKSSFNHGGQEKSLHDKLRKPMRTQKTLVKEDTPEIVKDMDEFFDCPKSPDVVEVADRLPKLIPTTAPVKLPPSKVRALIDKLMVFSDEAKMLDEVIKEFAFQDMTFMVEIIIDKLSQDYHDKADNTLPPSPPMTSIQRILLGFLLKLERSTHPGIRDKFLTLAELQLFNRTTCKLEIVQPITRLYTALCKLRYDLNRIRRFIGEGFYFMENFALPMFFTILTMWPEVLPMESETSDNLLAKVIIQICFIKECNQPGYNLLPLRDLLKKYYGYPSEKWNCEEIFKEIMVEYIRNPSIRLSDFTLLLFLKNKPARWAYQKVKDTIIPLYNQAPDSNPNLKATLLILLANVCCGFEKYEEYDWSVILEMDKWFIESDRDNLDPLIKRGIHLARCRLPRRQRIKRKNKSADDENPIRNKTDNKDNLDNPESNFESMFKCAEDLTLEDPTVLSTQGSCKNSNKINIEGTIEGLKEEYNESTNNNVNNID